MAEDDPEGLYKSFNRDELEWVILHEAGHCVLWHNFQAFLIQLVILLFGIYIIWRFNLSIIVSSFISVFFSLFCIQVIRWTIEYSADKFSIDRVDNPKGVITAQDKFKTANTQIPFHSEDSIFRFLLHWNIYPSRRIRMARQRRET